MSCGGWTPIALLLNDADVRHNVDRKADGFDLLERILYRDLCGLGLTWQQLGVALKHLAQVHPPSSPCHGLPQFKCSELRRLRLWTR